MPEICLFLCVRLLHSIKYLVSAISITLFYMHIYDNKYKHKYESEVEIRKKYIFCRTVLEPVGALEESPITFFENIGFKKNKFIFCQKQLFFVG